MSLLSTHFSYGILQRQHLTTYTYQPIHTHPLKLKSFIRLCKETEAQEVKTIKKDVLVAITAEKIKSTLQNGASANSDREQLPLPSGELEFVERTSGQVGATWFRLFFAIPWRRFKKDSVLVMKLDGEIPDKVAPRIAGSVSVPQICRSLEKAAYDPRIVGVCIKVGFLACGWAKLQEIRRYFEFFKKSGKFTIAYMERGGEKEYYLASVCEELYMPPSANLLLRGLAVQGTFVRGVLDKIGVEPQVKRIGKYKSAGDQILRTDMSDAQREQLTALLDDIYKDFVSGSASSRNKTVEEFESLLEDGIYKMEEFKERAWVTDLLYEDQVKELLEKRTGGKDDVVRKVGIKKYAWVSPSAFGLNGKKCIGVLRTTGQIVSSELPSQGSITVKQVVAQLRQLEKNKSIEAIVLRVDSPGGDALASDIMWREIQRIDKIKPVVGSMGDVSASGGYYMSMATRKIVAEALTITGSIGVVTGKFNLQDLYQRIGFKKEVIPKGKFAEVLQEYRGFTEEEQELFDKSAEYFYEQFRNKAASSRGMSPEDMQALAQGRVWTGSQAVKNGLVDAIGGINRAVEIAKQLAGIPSKDRVTVLEFSRQELSFQQILASGAITGLLSVLNTIDQYTDSDIFQVIRRLVYIASQDSRRVIAELTALMSSNVLCLAEHVEVEGVSTINRRYETKSIYDDDEWLL